MTTRRALAAIGIMASLGCVYLAAQARTGTRRFTLSGTVVDAGNRPLAGVELSLQTERWKDVGDPAISDAQGRFAFGALAPGEYILSAESSSFGTVRYGEAPDPGWVGTVSVGGESGDKSVVFSILPRGAIEGVIRDEFGDPMTGAMITVSRPVWRDGRSVTTNLASKGTDDRGRYRFGNLAPGNYTVCAGGGQTAPVPGPADYATRVENRFYARTCGRSFQLAPGQHGQVDLNPLVSTAATVRGRVRNVPPQNGFSAYLQSDDADMGGTYNAFVDGPQGTFTIRGVPPGRYRLRAQGYHTAGGQQKPLVGDLPVDVGGTDIDGLDLALDAPATVDVTLHGLAENQIDPDDVNVNLTSTNGAPSVNRGTVREKDGGFHFEAVSPGTYRLQTHTSGETCVESVKLGDREVRGVAFEVPAGAALHFEATASKHCGSIRLRAVRDDAAVPSAKVVLLFTGTPRDPGQIIEDFADDEGHYSFTGLPPGRYLVWAWAVQGKGAMAGPASLAAVEKQATVVEVTAGDPVHVDVPLLSDEGKAQ